MLFYIYDFFFGGFKDGVCLVWFSYLVNVAILFGPGFSAIVFFKLMFYLINIYEREGIRARAGGLQYVKDAQDNILSENKYHYKN